MKRTISIVLSLVLLLVLCSCVKKERQTIAEYTESRVSEIKSALSDASIVGYSFEFDPDNTVYFFELKDGPDISIYESADYDKPEDYFYLKSMAYTKAISDLDWTKYADLRITYLDSEESLVYSFSVYRDSEFDIDVFIDLYNEEGFGSAKTYASNSRVHGIPSMRL